MYDHTGKLVKQVESEMLTPETAKFSQKTASNYFHLKFLEKYYFKWLTIGADMRVNLSVILACIGCFSVVYFPAVWYDERHMRIETLATLDKDIIDKKNYEEFLYRTGKKSRFEHDTFKDFSTI